MATPKSANERIRRKLRRTRKFLNKDDNSKIKDININGRLQVKKSGNNDPRRNRGMSEEFLSFYRGKTVDNPERFNKIIDEMINIAVELGGKYDFPFKINRLNDMKGLISN